MKGRARRRRPPPQPLDHGGLKRARRTNWRWRRQWARGSRCALSWRCCRGSADRSPCPSREILHQLELRFHGAGASALSSSRCAFMCFLQADVLSSSRRALLKQVCFLQADALSSSRCFMCSIKQGRKIRKGGVLVAQEREQRLELRAADACCRILGKLPSVGDERDDLGRDLAALEGRHCRGIQPNGLGHHGLDRPPSLRQ